MDRIDWNSIIRLVLFVGGGLGAMAMGQVEIGIAMVGAAVGNAIPGSPLKSVQQTPERVSGN